MTIARSAFTFIASAEKNEPHTARQIGQIFLIRFNNRA